MATTNIKQSTAAYERWLRAQLRGEIIEKDLRAKHERMAEGPFPFLRATYWRWSEIILDVCPDLAKAPSVLAIGDIHLENFGTWRDVEGRLVWGINDFDEAAEMPYAIDLVRLAASALLASDDHQVAARDACASILEGYAQGLAAPGPIVLDGTYGWLRRTLAMGDKQRARHQAGLRPSKTAHPPRRYVEALRSVLPDGAIELACGPRTAGTGSLGRPRWIGYAEWRGGSLVREAKALVPSAWTLPPGRLHAPLRCGELAGGRYRSPDPWYVQVGNIVVRRLSPSNRKIEIADPVFVTHGTDLLAAMGHELATVHLGVTDRRKRIQHDLEGRRRRWLREAAEAAADAVAREQRAWRKKNAK